MIDWFVAFLAYSMLPMLFPIGMPRLESALFWTWRVGQVGLLLLIAAVIAREAWRASSADRWFLGIWGLTCLFMLFSNRPLYWDAVVVYDRVVRMSLAYHGLWQGLIRSGSGYMFTYPPGGSLSVMWGLGTVLRSNTAQTILLGMWMAVFSLRYLRATNRWYASFVFFLLYFFAQHIGWHHLHFYNNIVYGILWGQLIVAPLFRVRMRWWEQVASGVIMVWFRPQIELAVVPIISCALIQLLLDGPKRRTLAVALLALVAAYGGARLWQVRTEGVGHLLSAQMVADEVQSAADSDPASLDIVIKNADPAKPTAAAPAPAPPDHSRVYREAIDFAWGLTYGNYSLQVIIIGLLWLFALAAGWRIALAYLVPALTPAAFLVGTARFAVIFPDYQTIPDSLIRLEIMLPVIAAGMVVALDAELARQAGDLKWRLPMRERLDQWGARWSASPLIRLDARVLATLGFIAVLFTLVVGFKVHGSSMSTLAYMITDRQDPSEYNVLRGHPLRNEDELGIESPLVLAQVNRGFKSRNPALGGGRAGLLSAPVRNYFGVFHPESYGFYLLDIERGFSFYWYSARFFLFVSCFLLLLLLTRDHYWLALLGAGWLTESAFFAWCRGQGEVGAACWMVLCGAYALFSPRRGLVVAAVIGLVLAAMGLRLHERTCSTVALLLPALLVLAAWSATRASRQHLAKDLRFRVAAIAAGAVLLIVSAVAWRYNAKEALTLAAHRLPTTAAEWRWSRLMVGNYGQDDSGFVLLFPLVFIAAVVERFWRRLDWVQLTLAGLALALAVTLLWALHGPSPRETLALSVLPPLALSSVALCICHLAGAPALSPSRWWRLGGMTLAVVVLVLAAWRGSPSPPLELSEIVVTVLWVSFVAAALLSRRTALFALLLAYQIVPGMDATPLFRGLQPVFDAHEYQVAEELAQRDPHARWLVFGGVLQANFFKAAGAAVLNGTTLVPDPATMTALDPSGAHHQALLESPHLAVTLSNQPTGTLTVSPDKKGFITASLHPCGRETAQLRINYVVLLGAKAEPWMTCLNYVTDRAGVWIYRRAQ